MARNSLRFTDEEVTLQAAGGPLKFTIRTPELLGERPALLIALAGAREAALDGQYFRIAPDVFLAAGRRVASFDMPAHGENLEPLRACRTATPTPTTPATSPGRLSC